MIIEMKVNSIPIEEELRKNPSLKKADIEKLRKWCDEKHYPPSESDSDLVIFLHSSYYLLEKAKLNIVNYYAARQSLPQFFENRFTLSEQSNKIFDTLAIVPLAKRTREGYKVILVRPLDLEKRNIKCNDAIKVFNMVLDLNIYEEGTQTGYVFVVDVHGTKAFDSNSFDVAAMRKYYEYLKKSVPIRWFGLHFINTLLPFKQNDPFTMLTIVQNDNDEATYFHLNLDSLNEIVPVEALPDEMGGKAGALMDLQAAQVKKLHDFSTWFTFIEIKAMIAQSFRELKNEVLHCFESHDQSYARIFI